MYGDEPPHRLTGFCSPSNIPGSYTKRSCPALQPASLEVDRSAPAVRITFQRRQMDLMMQGEDEGLVSPLEKDRSDRSDRSRQFESASAVYEGMWP